MRLFLLIIACLLSKLFFSQDTLRFTNNEIKAVKVIEVGINEIKYLRHDNLTGPTYSVNKNDVRSIKYANGQSDVFNTATPSSTQVYVQPQSANTISSAPEKITIHGHTLIYRNKPMGESRLWKVIMQEPNNPKKDLLIKEYQNMKSYKKRQYLFGFVGLGVGVAAAYAGLMGSVFTEDPAPIVGGLVVGLGVGVTGAVISGINKSKRVKKKLEIAQIFNN